jgi:hypothetical protein
MYYPKTPEYVVVTQTKLVMKRKKRGRRKDDGYFVREKFKKKKAIITSSQNFCWILQSSYKLYSLTTPQSVSLLTSCSCTQGTNET